MSSPVAIDFETYYSSKAEHSPRIRGFDETVVAEMIKRQWIPNFRYDRFTCTSQMASYVWGVDTLADACNIDLI